MEVHQSISDDLCEVVGEILGIIISRTTSWESKKKLSSVPQIAWFFASPQNEKENFLEGRKKRPNGGWHLYLTPINLHSLIQLFPDTHLYAHPHFVVNEKKYR